MRRADSTLFAPYRSMGVVCSDVRPVIRPNESKTRMTSLICPVDNVVMHYKAEKLRLVGVSDVLPDIVTAVAADRSGVYAAAGTSVAVMRTCRHISRFIDVGARTKFMKVLGDYLVIIDEENGIRVISISDGQQILHMEGSKEFQVTAVVHPSTYMYKILVGSSIGTMRLINFRTARIIHEFSKGFDSAITVLEQSPAVDVMAIGLANGQIFLHNVRIDETICKFRHEKAISAIGFRNDDKPFMTTADIGGDIVIWNLEKRQLVGKISDVHHAAVTELYFMPGEPVMVSASADNSLRTWVLDGGDGMPRQLVVLEGHAEGVTAVQFNGKQEVLSSGLDGSVRKYMVNVETMRQKLGSAGTISRAQAKKRHIPVESIKMEPVIDIALGWSREAAWDNVLCRHKDTLLVTTWTTRKNSQGTHKLVHERFTKDALLSKATATAIALSPCGNFAFIGYSTGHVDQFNVQSGLHVKTFVKHSEKDEELNKKEKAKQQRAHEAKITALVVDARGSELITGCSSGRLKYWQVRTGKLLATMRTRLRIERSAPCTSNSLLAVACAGDEGASVAVIDTLCRRVVRSFTSVGKSVNAMTFSSDGRWLLTADDMRYIRVWELSTSQLIDVMLFDKPCIGLSFNSTGEYLATVHKGEKSIFIWANKKMYASHVNIRALPLDYLPTWKSHVPEIGVNTFVIDDESDDEWEGSEQVDESLVTYSGLAPSRWANLPDLALIKERNKPDQPARKPKQAPFFLTAAPTLEGFEFEVPQEDEDERRRTLQAKRSLLELESSFSSMLRAATSDVDLCEVFLNLKKMSVSAIDFQLRTLPADLLPKFFKMLAEVLKTRKDFDLVQAYLATAMKIHRSTLWRKEGDKKEADELTNVLEELSLEEERIWSEYDQVIVENAAVTHWVKNALI
ncbi:Utp21 specific WD40 associated domain protein [Ancylostoma caninum]|uniref:Utp21 specific WD40 associated domain protein n=1 Tax=Ancylostoma caninum TaxID=29170 RepID=A0A368H137_ANCCA|nr:Utp21 specific WD40 associated domain protein [Ancylostoma caninum]